MKDRTSQALAFIYYTMRKKTWDKLTDTAYLITNTLTLYKENV